MNRRSRIALLVLTLLLLALPSLAYTVYLKDGSTVQARKKYRIDGDNAVITLVNGSESFLPLARIDIPKTDRQNKSDYGGTAIVLEDNKKAPAPQPAPTAPKGSLAELINSRSVGTRLPEPTVRPKGSPLSTDTPAASALPRPKSFYETPAGQTSRRPYPNTEVTDAVASYLRGQGIEEFRLYAGAATGQILIEATTASEASAFKAITVAANALLKVRSKSVSALELAMETPAGDRAGTFLITPEQATELAGNKVEVSEFYVQNVRF